MKVCTNPLSGRSHSDHVLKRSHVITSGLSKVRYQGGFHLCMVLRGQQDNVEKMRVARAAFPLGQRCPGVHRHQRTMKGRAGEAPEDHTNPGCGDSGYEANPP